MPETSMPWSSSRLRTSRRLAGLRYGGQACGAAAPISTPPKPIRASRLTVSSDGYAGTQLPKLE
ncbi:hypothetical protein V1227_10355 [Lentzea sp. DG1S-22]|uniref:hypothetical protein n=1 Tax=Lentzea sp. DG1S-22 TaxID=3108822 RepID=UPI002E7982EF|nr:hypothetical protein [Lentzea sp. DG1S-22]WVH83123.1 hypothetical protein V1227_10355 [Lentzea sp. DG1S-22]